ncbi:PDZ domain-containing protein [Erythrobacter sp. T5W1-R]|uniref:PDZ domain-containing protein n=1 Tax=Erythrobacter sp. T5W1-R TaxID=3101752 RepID=UPI002AFFE420|nr:PDZ domain-containing protein [Erythrobacter sp. T5W1-R]MEA1619573.1 PDZ domain-containing protein [Erythrobacter sp. T5W1-R]
MAWFLLALFAQPAVANDWEKFFVAVPQEGAIDATTEPEVLPSFGDIDKDLEAMFRRGFVAVGYTSFNSSNSKTNDGERLGKKIHARYMIVSTNLISSQTGILPLVLPNTTTTYTNGTASIQTPRGYAQGTYSGTTTTQGTQTSFVPYTNNRYAKTAIYFKEIPRKGSGLKVRDLSSEEMKKIGTRHAFVVQFVRDNSPAFDADIFPGDIVIQVNDLPATATNWRNSINGPQPMQLKVLRDGSPKDITMNVPKEWQGLP